MTIHDKIEAAVLSVLALAMLAPTAYMLVVFSTLAVGGR